MKHALDEELRIEKIRYGVLTGERPREAGYNARKGIHGKYVDLPLVEITINGKTGFGWSKLSKKEAMSFIGQSIAEFFDEEGLITEKGKEIEFPLLDWLGHYKNVPVYALFDSVKREGKELSVPCYDTSLYFDDIHIEDDDQAVQFMINEVQQGWDQGHRAFKIKIGRGARWMSLEKGMKRDISIVNGIRNHLGEGPLLMVDANNGYNLSLTKYFLEQTAGAQLTWIEEPFHEDSLLLEDLKEWLKENNLNILISDGEGLAAPCIVDWGKQHLLDIIQYDLKDYGFSNWIKLGKCLDEAGVQSAPHNYSGVFGNFASCHLVPLINNFKFVEWDETHVEGLDASSYSIHDGKVVVQNNPGFGLKLNEVIFKEAVKSNGWIIAS